MSDGVFDALITLFSAVQAPFELSPFAAAPAGILESVENVEIIPEDQTE